MRQAETRVVMMRRCRLCGGGAFSPVVRMSAESWHLSLGTYLELFLASRAYRNGAPMTVCAPATSETSTSSSPAGPAPDAEGSQAAASASVSATSPAHSSAAPVNDGAGASNGKLDAPSVADGAHGTACNHRLFSDMDHLFAYKNGLITFRFAYLQYMV